MAHARLTAVGFECALPQGSFYLFPRRHGLASRGPQLQARHGLYFLNGAVFGLDDPDFLRLCVLQPENDLEEILKALEDA